jgi:predicted metalloprotease with PDZ domain
VAFPNAAHHEAEITVTFTDLDPGALRVRMSRTSPGRYSIHEFAKNVYNFRATGIGGRAATVTRPDLHEWIVSNHGGEVSVTYTLFGDHANGTYSGIDRSHAHLNAPATFVWAPGLDARPVELRVRVPDGSGWRVATQLAPTDDPFAFSAPDLAYFLDSPIEVSDFWERTWEVPGPAGSQTVRATLHHAGTDAEAEKWARDAEAIVAAEADVFGVLPRFDYGTYTFLACYLPWVYSDGMEHRNSTSLTSPGSLAANDLPLLSTVAHEFFHAWSMERIRSAAIEPFDFADASFSEELWFGEGFTSYYTSLALWRSGLIDDAAFAASMGVFASSVLNARGRRYYSAVEMSQQAAFIDASVSVDRTNRANTFLSYYTWGAAIGLGLDLTLRTRATPLTLDHVMRDMWRAHGSPEIPYTLDDVEAALARVTNDGAFARAFFDRFVRGRDAVDYVDLLAAAGITLARSEPGSPSLGAVELRFDGEGATVAGNTLVGSPLYEAGVDYGDRITHIGGRAVSSNDHVGRALAGRRPGDVLEVRYVSRGEEVTTRLTLAESEGMIARLDPSAPPAARTLLTSWREAIP